MNRKNAAYNYFNRILIKKILTQKIRKSYSGQFENDIKLPSNTGSLQINLLPSDDPNVINLNISTATGKQKVSVGQQSAPESLPDVNFDPSPLAVRKSYQIFLLKSAKKISLRPFFYSASTVATYNRGQS